VHHSCPLPDRICHVCQVWKSECTFTFYTTITDALGVVAKDERIEVHEGVYPENITIDDMNITVIAVGDPVIDAQGLPVAVRFTRDGNLSKLVNFTVVNANFGVQVDTNGSTVNSTIVTSLTGPSHGIELTYADNSTVENNNVSNNEVGILIDPSDNITVRGNNISNNNIGIHVVQSSRINMSFNNISNSAYATGIHAELSSVNITSNRVLGGRYGIIARAGHLSNISHNYIADGTFFAPFTDSGGVHADLLNSTIIGNVVVNNSVGIAVEGGSQGNEIRDNNITNNILGGLGIGGSFNIVVSNNISMTGLAGRHNNVGIGLPLYAGLGWTVGVGVTGNNNTLSRNTISDNDLGLFVSFTAADNVIDENVICNAKFEIVNYTLRAWSPPSPSLGFPNHGNNNTCNSTLLWNDAGTHGCARRCTVADTKPPDFSNESPIGNTNSTTPTISVNITDTQSDINETSIVLTVNGVNQTPTSITPITGGFLLTYSPVEPFGEGAVSVRIYAADNAGNPAFISWEFLVNLTPPETCSIPAPHVTSDITLCPGRYRLTEPVLVDGNNLTLTCNRTELISSDYGILINELHTNLTIQNCSIQAGIAGIVLLGGNTEIRIYGNTISGGALGGIHVFTGSEYAPYRTYGESLNVSIARNNISGNLVGIGGAMDGGTILNNSISGNYVGVNLQRIGNIALLNNDIISSMTGILHGMFVGGDNNVIEGGRIANNTLGALIGAGGNMRVLNGNFSSNSNGIFFLGAPNASINDTIACFNHVYDIINVSDTYGWVTGSNNTCDTTYNFSDEWASGCTRFCTLRTFNFSNSTLGVEVSIVANNPVTVTITNVTDPRYAVGNNTTGNISKFVNITADAPFSWAQIRIYYNESEVNESGVNESTLRIWRYNATNDSWDYIDDSGVDTAANYTWANVTSFSIYAAIGIPVPPLRSPRELKSDSITELNVSKTGIAYIDARINEAISHIRSSLNDSLWLDDFHLAPEGKKVFEEEKAAVEKIETLLVNGSVPGDVKRALADIKDKLISADKTIASTLIDNASKLAETTEEIKENINTTVSMPLPKFKTFADSFDNASYIESFRNLTLESGEVTLASTGKAFVPYGRFVSLTLKEDDYVATVLPYINASVPPGTSLSVSVSSDNGATWERARSGILHIFGSAGKQLKYMVELKSDNTGTIAPAVFDVSLVYEVSPVISDPPPMEKPQLPPINWSLFALPRINPFATSHNSTYPELPQNVLVTGIEGTATGIYGNKILYAIPSGQMGGAWNVYDTGTGQSISLDTGMLALIWGDKVVVLGYDAAVKVYGVTGELVKDIGVIQRNGKIGVPTGFQGSRLAVEMVDLAAGLSPTDELFYYDLTTDALVPLGKTGVLPTIYGDVVPYNTRLGWDADVRYYNISTGEDVLMGTGLINVGIGQQTQVLGTRQAWEKNVVFSSMEVSMAKAKLYNIETATLTEIENALATGVYKGRAVLMLAAPGTVPTIGIYDMTKGELNDTGIMAYLPVTHADKVAFTISESSYNLDLNGDGDKSDNIIAYIKVKALHDFEMTIDPESAGVYPGGTANYTLTLENTGTVADTFSIAVAGLDAEKGKPEDTKMSPDWVHLNQSLVTIAPGESAPVTLQIAIPDDWASMQTTAYPFEVTVSMTTDSVVKKASASLGVRETKRSMAEYVDYELDMLASSISDMNVSQSVKDALLGKVSGAIAKKELALASIIAGDEVVANQNLAKVREILKGLVSEEELGVAKSEWQEGTNLSSPEQTIEKFQSAWEHAHLALKPVIAPKVVKAIIDIDPDALNLKSKGNWITAYIEIPGHNVSQINVSTIRLNGSIPAEKKPTAVGDYDRDGVPDLMVKFDRAKVQNIVHVGNNTLTVSGRVGEVTFEGSDRMRVI
jgi:parallel beta-helix repeat protein